MKSIKDMTIWEALDPYVLMWVWGILFTVVLVRYLVMSGVAYMIFWKWQHKRLQHGPCSLVDFPGSLNNGCGHVSAGSPDSPQMPVS